MSDLQIMTMLATLGFVSTIGMILISCCQSSIIKSYKKSATFWMEHYEITQKQCEDALKVGHQLMELIKKRNP